MHDLLIIGASAAGVPAAVYAKRRKLDVLIITDDFGGEMARSGEIENWPGVVHTTGVELADEFRKQVEANDIPMKEGVRVKELKKEDGVFVMKAERNGETLAERARTVIVATGVHPRMLNIPGEKELKNKGLSYCTVCDGPLFGGKTVATIGGGNSALESAIMLSEIAEKVYVINKNPKFKGDDILIEKVTEELSKKNVELIYNVLTQEIVGNDFVTGLKYKSTEDDSIHSLEVEGVFVHIGMIPNTDFVPDEVERSDYGEILVDEQGQTNVPGLFSAGDVTSTSRKQLAIASGQGVSALLSAVDYLNKQKVPAN